MDLLNCTSFGGRRAEPVDVGMVCGGGTDGCKGLSLGFVSVGFVGRLSFGGGGGFVGSCGGVGGFLGGFFGGLGLASPLEGLPGGFPSGSCPEGLVPGRRRGLRSPPTSNDWPKWKRCRWHMLAPYLATQGCCGSMSLLYTTT